MRAPLAFASLLTFAWPVCSAAQIVRASVASDGTQANDGSLEFSMSRDGRVVAFASTATNLVPGDTNGQMDIFVRDLQAGTTTRVSVASDGSQADGSSFEPAVSADGRVVVFTSLAANLVAGDAQLCPGTRFTPPSNCADVFVHDRQTGVTSLVSRSTAGVQGNLGASAPGVSGDGRLVVFLSSSSNLVTGDTNVAKDVFLHDRATGETLRLSVTSNGSQVAEGSFSPAISDDGRVVAFQSGALGFKPAGMPNCGAFGCPDIVVRDLRTGATSIASVASDGTPANFASSAPRLSTDGRFVVFGSVATTLVPINTGLVCDVELDGIPDNCEDVFVHDRSNGRTRLVNAWQGAVAANRHSSSWSISGDGRFRCLPILGG